MAASPKKTKEKKFKLELNNFNYSILIAIKYRHPSHMKRVLSFRS